VLTAYIGRPPSLTGIDYILVAAEHTVEEPSEGSLLDCGLIPGGYLWSIEKIIVIYKMAEVATAFLSTPEGQKTVQSGLKFTTILIAIVVISFVVGIIVLIIFANKSKQAKQAGKNQKEQSKSKQGKEQRKQSGKSNKSKKGTKSTKSTKGTKGTK